MTLSPRQKSQPAYLIYHLNVFAKQAYSGNAATVIWQSNGLNKHQMQTLAREFNTPESVFIARSDQDQLSLRFFTPTAK